MCMSFIQWQRGCTTFLHTLCANYITLYSDYHQINMCAALSSTPTTTAISVVQHAWNSKLSITVIGQQQNNRQIGVRRHRTNWPTALWKSAAKMLYIMVPSLSKKLNAELFSWCFFPKCLTNRMFSFWFIALIVVFLLFLYTVHMYIYFAMLCFRLYN